MTKKTILVSLLVWALICTLLALSRSLPILSGELGDTDDYLRFVRVFQLLDGETTHGYIINRMGVSGGGVAWTPVLDWFLAVPVALGSLFMDRQQAALWTATLYPPIVLFIFILTAFWYVRQTGNERLARLTPLALLLLWAVLFQFAPGRVDHHNLQAIILAITCGFLIRLYRFPDKAKVAMFAGGLMAVAWSIGAEAVPWVALVMAAIGIFWLWHGGAFLRAGYSYAAALLLGTIVLIPITRGFDGFIKVECDGISLSYLSFALVGFLFWQGLRLLPVQFLAIVRGRFAVGTVLGLVLAVLLYLVMGDCLLDPYSVSDPLLREMWLDRVDEAKPALSYWKENKSLVILSPGSLLAGMIITLFALWRDKPERRALWAGFALMLAGAFALSLWQVRIGYLGQVLAILPFAWFFLAASEKASALFGRYYLELPRSRRLAVSVSFFLIALGLFALSVSVHKESSDAKQSAIKEAICDIQAASHILNSYSEQKTVAAFVVDGGELLFRTPHHVLAGSYQRSAEGILAAHKILGAPSAKQARLLIDRYHVDILVVCRDDLDYWDEILGQNTSLARQLWDGEVPAWIVVKAHDEEGGFGLYEVSF